jgi:hypothetical protein
MTPVSALAGTADNSTTNKPASQVPRFMAQRSFVHCKSFLSPLAPLPQRSRSNASGWLSAKIRARMEFFSRNSLIHLGI